MTVDQLRELLAGVPGHLPVVIEVTRDGSGGGADTDFVSTEGAEVSGAMHAGRFLAIITTEAL